MFMINIISITQVEFLKLNDITNGMAEPCVMDIKIGRRTWDPLATEEKRIVESVSIFLVQMRFNQHK